MAAWKLLTAFWDPVVDPVETGPVGGLAAAAGQMGAPTSQQEALKALPAAPAGGRRSFGSCPGSRGMEG